MSAFERYCLQRAAVGRADDARALSRELRARIDYWSEGGASRSREMPTLAAELSALLVARLIVVFGAIALAALLLSGLIWLAVPVVLIAWLIHRRATQRGLLVRLNLALGGRCCPACGYDLSGSVPAIPPEDLEGQWIGPRRCPECGAAWPLLPPPVPGNA